MFTYLALLQSLLISEFTIYTFCNLVDVAEQPISIF